MKKVLSWCLALTVLFVSLTAAADPAACRKDAQAFANGPNGKKFSAASFIDAEARSTTLKLDHPCAGTACDLAYFSETPLAIPIPMPQQYEPAPSYGTLSKPDWHPLPVLRGSSCTGGVMLVLAPASGARGAPSGTQPHEKSPDASLAATSAARFRADIQGALSAYHDSRTDVTPSPALGTAQGLEDVAADALQALGQVVADRASAQAYSLVKSRLETLLGCAPDPTPNAASAAPVASAPPAAPAVPTATQKLIKPTFPATCKVLGPLRMEDIATSRDALLGAIAQDGLSYLQNVQGSLTDDQKKAEEIGAAAVIGAVVIPLIVRPKLLADSTQAQAIVGALESYVDKHSSDINLENKAQRAIAAGVLAYTRCVYEAAAPQGAPVASCSFSAYSDSYAGDDPETQIAARALAAQLIAIATLNNAQGQPDALERVIHAVDTIFASSCMLAQASEKTPPPLEFKCPAPPDAVDLTNIPPTAWLSFGQPIVDAALERDSNALVASIAQALEAFSAAEYAADHRRAFLLIGSLVQYAATYAGQTSTNAQQLQDQRTEILESLTEAMTDRTARDGDNIWSFGGSLRMVGGLRIGGTSPAVLSPLSLPLGIGFDHVSGGAAGVHLEFSPIDLGQYISYDNKTEVQTPKVADAVAPSFTIAAGWGRSMPLVLGATFGYSPSFRLDPNKDTRGTFNVGATLGIYVPLIDMN
jgi:hypothetical protein